MPRRLAALLPVLALVSACAGGGAGAAPPAPAPPSVSATPAPTPAPASDETRYLRDLRTTSGVDIALGDRTVVALGRSACEGFARGEPFATIAGRTASASAGLGERNTRALVRSAGLFLCPGDVTDLPALDAPATSTPPPPPPPSPSPPPAEPPSDTWTYRVTGPATALITYQASGGNVSQVNGAELPWTTTVEAPGISGMTFAHVSAQNSGGGTISCQIIGPGGTVVSQNSSQGDFAIVTCQN